jgi:hypothetical protein
LSARALEAEVYRRQGFGQTLGIQGAVGLLIVDFVNGFADPAIFGGGNISSAIARTRQVLSAARKAGWAVAHSRIVYAEDGADANVFSIKVPGDADAYRTRPGERHFPGTCSGGGRARGARSSALHSPRGSHSRGSKLCWSPVAPPAAACGQALWTR